MLQMDMSKVDNTKTHDMLQSIMDVLQTNSYCDRQGRCEQVTVASELDDLREELEQARMRKNRAEEEYINQIIQVIRLAGVNVEAVFMWGHCLSAVDLFVGSSAIV